VRKTLFALMLVLGVFALATGHAAQPSAGCAGGALPGEAAPSGISIKNTGDPTTGTGTLQICNNGAVIPSPAKGAATVSGNPTAQNGSVEVDGDSDNTAAACTDGFVRAGVNSSGPHFWEGPDGSLADTKPSQLGNQPATEVSPDKFVTDTVANCGPAVPQPPVGSK
jgi:hypothetical protein